MKPRLVRRVRIRGKLWRVVIGRPPKNKCDALCDSDRVHHPARTIWIRPSADRLAGVVHEVLHACFPDLEEKAIEEAEEAIVKVARAVAL